MHTLKIAIIFSVFGATISACGPGCLSCRGGVCGVCEGTAGYYLFEGSCAKSSTLNCEAVDSSGSCLTCSAKHFPDAASGGCLAVPANLEVAHCSVYAAQAGCARCEGGFAPLAGKCEEVPTASAIPNCAVYEKPGVCGVCAIGFVRSADNKVCAKMADFEGCRGQAATKCSKCMQGFVLDPNASTFALFLDSRGSFAQAFVRGLGDATTEASSALQCSPLSVANCAIHANPATCRVCVSGYYLAASGGGCLRNPDPSIPHCAVYRSLRECVRCEQGYFVSAPGRCTAVQSVENCAEYSADSLGSGRCVGCRAEYYLNGGICVRRLHLDVPRCRTYSIRGDACEACMQGLRVTNDGLACLAPPKNCVSFADSTRLSSTLVCTACEAGYLLDSGVCVKGQVDNCDAFESLTVCRLCLGGYVLRQNRCEPQGVVDGCQVFSPGEFGRCQVCSAGSAVFEIRSLCLPTLDIANCARLEAGRCAACAPGFFKASDWACRRIPMALHCLEMQEPGVCGRCEEGYRLVDGLCKQVDPSTAQHCDPSSLTAAGNCGVCKAGALPSETRDSFLCETPEAVRERMPGFRPDSDCLAYRIEGTEYQCLRCSGNLLPSGSVCLEVCSDPTRPQLSLIDLRPLDLDPASSDFESRAPLTSAICQAAAAGVENCAVVGPGVAGETSICLRCPRGLVEVVDPASAAGSSALGGSPVSRRPAVQCVATDSTLLGHTSNGEVRYCEYYYSVPEGHGLGCFRCARGFAGRVSDVVDHCATYHLTGVCETCERGFYLSTPSRCEAQPSVAGCAEYRLLEAGCSVCEAGKYLDAGACHASTPRLFCASYAASADACAVCVNGYYVLLGFCAQSTAVAECLNYLPEANGCKDCKTGFRLLNGACYSDIPNCLTAVYSVSKHRLDCTACNDKVAYRLTDFDGLGTCIAGTRTKCVKYSQTSVDTCEACAAGFAVAVSGGGCSAQPAISGCLDFDPTKLGRCLRCSSTTFMFQKVTQCEAPIGNCLEQTTLGRCDVCKAGYYVSADQTGCVRIPSESGCLEMKVLNTGPPIALTCLRCATGFTAWEVPGVTGPGDEKQFSCQSFLSFFRRDRDETAPVSGGCASGRFEVSFADASVCVEPSLLTALGVSAETSTRCLRFEKVGANVSCLECRTNYLLQVNGTCAETCPNNLAVLLLIRQGLSYFYKTRMCGVPRPLRVAQFSTADQTTLTAVMQNKCSYVISAVNDHFAAGTGPAYSCTACAAGSVPLALIAPFGASSAFGSLHTLPVSPVELQPLTTCVTLASSNLKRSPAADPTAPAVITNCVYYGTVESGKFACLKCKQGYTGKVVRPDSGPAFLANCDTEIPTCVKATEFSGLLLSMNYGTNDAPNYSVENNTPLSAFFSCHQCSAAGFIPVLFARAPGGAVGGVERYRLDPTDTDFTSNADDTNAGDMVRCLDMSAANFKTSLGLTPDSTFPANCGLAVVDVTAADKSSAKATSATQDGTKLAAFCGACKPGYRPVFAKRGTTTSVIISCEEITSCRSSTWFNSCSDCAYLWESNNFQYTKCAATSSDPNCFSADSTGACKICRKGFEQATTGQCTSISSSLCASASLRDELSSAFGGTAPLRSDSTNSYFFRPSSGCQTCSSTDVPALLLGLPASAPSVACVAYSNPPFAALTGCESHVGKTLGELLCKKCASNYVPSSNGRCVLRDSVKHLHCTEVQSNTAGQDICTVCESSAFVLVAAKCLPLPENCAAAIDSSGQLECTECGDGFELKPDKTCAIFSATAYPSCARVSGSKCATCVEGFELVQISGGKWHCFPLAREQLDPNCLVLNPLGVQSFILSCMQCAPGYFAKTIELSACLAHTASPDARCFYYTPPNIGYVSNSESFADQTLKCQASSNVPAFWFDEATETVKDRTILSHCLEFHPREDACLTCESGYIVSSSDKSCVLEPSNPLSIEQIHRGFVRSCDSMTSCSNTFFEGLSVGLEQVFSCHQCSRTGEIPFAALRLGSDRRNAPSLSDYSLSSETPNLGTGGFSNSCLAPVASTFGLGQSSRFAFPSQCALGVINTDVPADASHSARATGVDRAKVSVTCAACRPGFAASLAKDSSDQPIAFMVSQCTAIENCASSTWFNACSSCKPGFTYPYSTEKGVDYSTCAPFADSQCFAFQGSSCIYCRPGYSLSSTGACLALRSPRCADDSLPRLTVFRVSDMSTGVFLASRGLGCKVCDTGFVSVYQPGSRLVCAASDVSLPGNCFQFGLSLPRRCAKCRPGFVLSGSGECFPSSGLPRCLLANSANSCALCSEGFVLVNNFCALPAIKNCAVYLQLANQPGQTCLQCSSGYYLSNGACLLGSIPNCAVFASPSTCITCRAGFAALNAGGSTRCVRLPPALNCDAADDSLFQAGVIECRTCAAGSFVVGAPRADQPKSACLSPGLVDNCRTYNMGPTVSASSFLCMECVEGYFLRSSTNSCVRRTILPPECKLFAPDADRCAGCLESFYLSDSATQCLPRPTGTPHCVEYSSALLCSRCETQFSVSGGVCVEIPVTGIVPNCLAHLAPMECAQCQSGFFLQNGGCVAVLAENCLTLTSPTACATCPPSFGLQTSPEKTNCVPWNLPQCIQASDTFPFTCLVCASGMFPSPSGCVQVPSPIDKCSFYSSATQCTECQSPYVLSLDRSKCLAPVAGSGDPNCASSVALSTPACLSCGPGYTFVNSTCVLCNSNALSSGCFACNPFNTTQCVLCALGNYMDDQGNCQSNSVRSSN